MWGSASTVFAEHGGIESTSPPSYLPLAWGAARDGEDISEHHIIRGLRPGSPQHANGVAGADHKSCGSVGKPACSLLEVRAPDGNHLEAKLPAMDKNEQQKLVDLIASHSLEEVTVLLRRPRTSVQAMLHRLGASARMGQDWFTKHSLARALHVRAEEVQRWIDRGLLKCRIVEASGVHRQVIDAEAFCDFCKRHRGEIVGHRLNADRLSFVQTFVFPPSHMKLLPVREAKKERAAYDEQRKKEAGWEADADDELGATA